MYHIMDLWAIPILHPAPHISHKTITVAMETLWVPNPGIVNMQDAEVLDGELQLHVHDQSWLENKLEEKEPGHSWCHSSCVRVKVVGGSMGLKWLSIPFQSLQHSPTFLCAFLTL
jgi:hypothetical protein